MASWTRHRRDSERNDRRTGWTRIESVLVLAALGSLASLLWPLLGRVVEASRRSQCQSQLRNLSGGLSAYHEARLCLPPAAVWTTDQLDSLALNHGRRVDLYTRTNWAMSLLPYVGEQALAERIDNDVPIGADENEFVRRARIGLMICPSDTCSREDNPFRLTRPADKAIEFARGNYAINAGSHGLKDGPGSTSHRTGDAAHLEINTHTREFRYWGNGVAGFNVSFSFDQFENGLDTLVALEEVRAGVHATDPRGVWALGQIGGSVTWGHGANGDAYGPNNQHPKSDDLLDGDRLNRTVGAENLLNLGMPCVDYIDFNSQATARSRHPGGVNLVMVSGRSMFVSDAIDPGLWHVLHSRETPRQLLADDLESRIADSPLRRERPPPSSHSTLPVNRSDGFVNALGMEFAFIPQATFRMAMPDLGTVELPPEAPEHSVTISRGFFIGTHEVTRRQYASLCSVLPDSDSTSGESDLGALPMVQVTWHEARDFCRLLSAVAEEQSNRRRYRLPTEAEWEYACREGSSEPHSPALVDTLADGSGEAVGRPEPLPLLPIRSFRPNRFGLYDMRGNAWEWCSDWFDRDYYSWSSAVDPQGPLTGYLKVIRGGDWTFAGEPCELSYAPMPPWKRNPFVGFRVVCELVEN